MSSAERRAFYDLRMHASARFKSWKIEIIAEQISGGFPPAFYECGLQLLDDGPSILTSVSRQCPSVRPSPVQA